MNRTPIKRIADFKSLCFQAFLALTLSLTAVHAEPPDYTVRLATGEFVPSKVNALPTTATLTAGHTLIQFQGPLTDIDRDQLAAAGIRLLEYVPNFTYTARCDRTLSESDRSNLGVRWIGSLTPDQKLAPVMVLSGVPSWARRGGDQVQLTVAFHVDEDISVWAFRLGRDFGARILGSQTVTNAIELILPEGRLGDLTALDAVSFVEPALPPQQEHNNSCRSAVRADSAQSAPFNLNGSGIMLAQWDGGRADDTHSDFGGRVIPADTSALTNHATHVGGTILGSGLQSSGTYRGMAPSAQMLTRLWWSTSSELVAQYADAISNYGAQISNNSWGVSVPTPVQNSTCAATLGNYFIEDATIDNVVRGAAGAPVTIVWSAGNMRSTGSQYCGSIGWTYNTVDPLACAKNVIAVGAVNSDDNTMTTFSAWGPADDGRIKPDVMAPGCESLNDYGVTSAKLGGGYTVLCGTSMAAPVVSGVIALMRQRWNQLLPSDHLLPSTIKGILINSATDLGNPGPDYQNGWGLISAIRAVKKVGIGWPSYVESSIRTGVTHTYSLTVPAGVARMKISLVWDDVGGTALSGNALINDLDLVLIDPASSQVLPWVLNPHAPSNMATTGVDRVNNVEGVEVNNPASGIWLARVVGYNVPSGPQQYSLVFTPDSINGTSMVRAVDAKKERDSSANPGQTVSVGFWVVNNGGAFDSLRVRLTDSLGWLASTLDSTVRLNVFDSVHLAGIVTIPPGTAPTITSRIRMTVNSRSDTTATDTASCLVSTRTMYAVSLSPVPVDTIGSPAQHTITVGVQNTGNIANAIQVTAANDSGWTVLPILVSVNLAAGDSASAIFTLSVPSDAPHHAVNQTTISAVGSGGGSSSVSANIVVNNPFRPPTLFAPDTVAFMNNRAPLFIWSSSGTQYRLVVATDSSLAAINHAYLVTSDSSYALPPADSLSDGVYFWGVKGFAGTDSSSFQRYPRRLVIDNLPPSYASPISPFPDGYVNQTHFTFYLSVSAPINPVVAPEFNSIELCSDSAFTSGVTVYSPILADTLVIPDVIANGRWFWRVKREDKAGNTAGYSPARSFMLDTDPPPIPSLRQPPNGCVAGGNPEVVFRWVPTPVPPHPVAPDFYRFQLNTDSAFSGGGLVDSVVYSDSLALSHAGWSSGDTLYWRVRAFDSAGWASALSSVSHFRHNSYFCGDMDSNGFPDIADLTLLVSYLYLDGTPPNPLGTGSIDCEEGIDISDLSWLVAYLYLGGPPPCCF